MAKITINSMTEKGMLKTSVRNAIVGAEMEDFKAGSLRNYLNTEKKSVMYKEYTDAEGRSIYATFTLTVSYKHPSELINGSKKASSSSSSKIEIIE